ncbi:hypothetical protein GCM10007925_09550 [Sphingomonas astaxanthinifaciens DSM 22298]|uniref:Phage shock protein A (PspA) family protein n=2 Tax=Sphingomonas TaxID=13687 RepID=A0ABQ5Z900_9SPHN|nr:PspA/IM30 family protein [Sphingomonas astaxanthinifaciens]GLR47244.1 hypothetical protein GCM10007925_09550 [Sphingomonas astaxanthinifaciens DSM 22298]
MIEGVMGLLFGIFWIWVVIAGFKSVGRRIFGFVRQPTIWNRPIEARGIIWTTDGTPLIDSGRVVPTTVSNQPRELVRAPSDIWTPEERRTFGRKLASTPVASADAVVAEMQRELSKLVRNAADVEKNLAKWRGELFRIEAAQGDWQQRAELAVDKGRDALARAALEQKVKLEPRAQGLRADIGRMEELASGYVRDINALEAKLSESVRRQVLAESRLECAEDSVRARELVFGERTKSALSDLEQVERAADLAEGQAEALTIGGDPGLAGEFAALEKQDALDKELAALKAKRPRPAA